VAQLSGPASTFKLTTLTWNGSGSSDANGDTLSYLWNFGDGSSATTNTPTTTHSYAAVGSYHVTLTVNDGEASSSAAADVAIQSRPPVANAGPDQDVVQRSSARLNGAASDPDGTIAGVRWLQVAGPAVTLSGSTTLSPAFVAPRVSATTTLTFELTVTDSDGVSSSDRVNVNVTRK
jgi:PKD repeat protein